MSGEYSSILGIITPADVHCAMSITGIREYTSMIANKYSPDHKNLCEPCVKVLVETKATE